MAYATIRNKALRDEWRLITAKDDAGNTWYIPSGHFLIQFPIYDGYKVKKSQEVKTIDTSIQPILDGKYQRNDELAHIEDKVVRDRDDVECVVLSSADEKAYEWANKSYVDLFRELYPTAEFYIDADEAIQPIKVIDSDVLVGIIGCRKDRYMLNVGDAIQNQ